MIADINDRDIPLSFHVGDIGPGSSSTCTNAIVDRETARFDTLEKALVYTPGDNEWRDCSDELGRLAYIRQKVFRSDGKRSRGTSPIALTSQVGRRVPGERPVLPGSRHPGVAPHRGRQGQLRRG